MSRFSFIETLHAQYNACRTKKEWALLFKEQYKLMVYMIENTEEIDVFKANTFIEILLSNKLTKASLEQASKFSKAIANNIEYYSEGDINSMLEKTLLKENWNSRVKLFAIFAILQGKTEWPKETWENFIEFLNKVNKSEFFHMRKLVKSAIETQEKVPEEIREKIESLSDKKFKFVALGSIASHKSKCAANQVEDFVGDMGLPFM